MFAAQHPGRALGCVPAWRDALCRVRLLTKAIHWVTLPRFFGDAKGKGERFI